VGILNLTGNTGQFSLTETLYKSSGVVRSTAAGTYTVGADCSLSFKFSTTAGAKPISGFSKMKRRLDDLLAEELGAQPQPWCLHDIRRTFRTNLSALPVTEEVRERLLAYAQDELSATYNRYDYLDEKRRALELWTARLFDVAKAKGGQDAEARA